MRPKCELLKKNHVLGTSVPNGISLQPCRKSGLPIPSRVTDSVSLAPAAKKPILPHCFSMRIISRPRPGTASHDRAFVEDLEPDCRSMSTALGKRMKCSKKRWEYVVPIPHRHGADSNLFENPRVSGKLPIQVTHATCVEVLFASAYPFVKNEVRAPKRSRGD
jgi:hypothetical protein